MEFDRNLLMFQGTLYCFSKQGLLNKRDTLQQVIKELKVVVDSVPNDVRPKLAFLMVLHTKLSISEKLKNDNFVGQCITEEPYLEKEYLVIYVYYLRLQLELFKVIENCPGPLSFEVLEEIIRKLKEPEFCLEEFGHEHLYQLWQSVFVKLCKLVTKFHIENYIRKFATAFQDVYAVIQKVLVTLMGDEEFDGGHLYYFFKTLLSCIMLQKCRNFTDDPLYELSIQLNLNKECDWYDAMTDCIQRVFGYIPDILKCLTIDMWMFFSECHTGCDAKNSVQFLIGDVVYSILKEVKGEKLYNVPSDVLNCLSSIAINKLELIKKAGIDEIISNVKNGEKEWFKALVRHPGFTTKESVECLIDCLELSDSDDLSLILSTSYKHLSDDMNEDSTLMKKLFVSALKMTPRCEEWLLKIFQNYQPNLLSTSETQEELTETFNKISKGKTIPQCDIISLCVQSPLETVKKICHIALYDPGHSEFAVETLKLLKHACNMSHNEDFALLDYVVLKSLLEESTDKEMRSFVDLVALLGKENILTPLFHNSLLKCLKDHLESDSLEKAVVCLEILNVILDLKIFEFHKAAFLVFMSQVLGHFSWDLKSYSHIKADGRERADRIITPFMLGLEEEEYGSDILWARQEIQKSSEINQVYFCDLWFKFNRTWSGSGTFSSLVLALVHSCHKCDDLRSFLINFEEPPEIRASLILSLTVLLPVLTFHKWESIFRELMILWKNTNSEADEGGDVHHRVLDVFGSALQILSMNLKREEDTYPCYKYCLRNFAKLAKQFRAKMNEGSLMWVFEKIFLLLGEVEDEERRKSCWEIFSPLLMELAESLKQGNSAEAHKKEIEELLPFLDLKDVAEGLLKKLH